MQDLGQGNLGFTNLALVYGSFSFFSLLSVPINRKLGHKMSLFLAPLLYALWAFAFMMPAYRHQNKLTLSKEELEVGWLSDKSIMIISLGSAFLIGVAAAPLW